MYHNYVKRIIDMLLSFVIIVAFSPLFLTIAACVRVKLGGPILFKQQRPGKNKKIFTLYKFRTMTNKTDRRGNLLPDEMRVTKFGIFLRSTSLDELPEFFNILKGDMSLVGPRPLLVEYLPCYNKEQIRRHDVRPGLTGWAQVNGRNTISWEEKFKLDIQYVQKITFRRDLKILFLTVLHVLRRDGIQSQTSVTADRFTGTPVQILEPVSLDAKNISA